MYCMKAGWGETGSKRGVQQSQHRAPGERRVPVTLCTYPQRLGHDYQPARPPGGSGRGTQAPRTSAWPAGRNHQGALQGQLHFQAVTVYWIPPHPLWDPFPSGWDRQASTRTSSSTWNLYLSTSQVQVQQVLHLWCRKRTGFEWNSWIGSLVHTPQQYHDLWCRQMQDSVG